MKKITVIGLAVLLVMTSVLPVCADRLTYGAYSGENIVKNGSFLGGDGAIPEDWGFATFGEALFETFYDDSSDDDGVCVYSCGWGARCEQTLKVKPGAHAYMLEFDYIADADRALWLCFETPGTWNNLCDLNPPKAKKWTTYRTVVKTRPCDMSDEIVLRFVNVGTGADGNEVFVDNVKVTELEGYDMRNLVNDGGFEMSDMGTTVQVKQNGSWRAQWDSPAKIGMVGENIDWAGGSMAYAAANGKYVLATGGMGEGANTDVWIGLDPVENYNVDYFDYTLDFDVLYTNLTNLPYVMITPYDNTGSAGTTEEIHFEMDKFWEFIHIRIPLDGVIDDTTMKINVAFASGNCPLFIDNVSVTPNITYADFLDKDGKMLSALPETEGDVTVRAQYYDPYYNTEAKAMLIVASYSKDANGCDRVDQLTVKELKYGDKADITLKNISAGEGKSVKAFIWNLEGCKGPDVVSVLE